MSAKKDAAKTSRIRLLWSFTKGGRVYIFIAAVTSILSVLFNFFTPQVIRVTIDNVLGDAPFSLPAFLNSFLEDLGGRAFLREHLYLCALAALLFSVLYSVSNLIAMISTAKVSDGTLKRLRDRLFVHISRLPYSWHIKNQTGDIIQRCTSDVEVIRKFLSDQVLELVRITLMCVAAVSLMFSMNPRLTTVSLVFMPLVVLYTSLFSGKIHKRFLAADEAEGALSATVQENLTGVRVVRAFGRQAHEVEMFDNKNNAFADYWIRLSRTLGVYWGMGDFVSGLQIFAIVILGTIFVVNGELTLGEFTVFISYNSMLAWPLRSLGRVIGEMTKTGVSLGRLNEILQATPEADDPAAQTPPLDRDIVFSNISFAYADGPEILQNVSFHVKAGQTIGILGGTGSGKSTLACLLNRLYDLEDGSITIGGVDIRDIRLSYLRQNVGFVLQEPFLFSKSIAQNIKNACPTRSDEEMRAAARTAAVDDTILSFSQGYDTVVGERGITLSGGQKQRVAIARMLLQKTPIKTFDDSLSAVDTQTDAKIRAALQTESANATVFLISHRITTIMHADKILVLDEGRLVQEGTHDTLCNTDGIYKRIYDLQRQVDVG